MEDAVDGHRWLHQRREASGRVGDGLAGSIHSGGLFPGVALHSCSSAAHAACLPHSQTFKQQTNCL